MVSDKLAWIQFNSSHVPQETTKQFRLLSASLAFLLWGAWAYYVNDGYEFFIRATSAATQGIASFIITLVMVRIVSWIFNFMPENKLRLYLPAIITVLCTGSLLYGIHWGVGTPKIIPTIAPALTVAFLFCVYTTFKLRNTAMTQEPQQ